MAGVLLLGFVLVIAILVCSFVQASFPVALSVVSLFVALMVAAGGGTMVEAIIGGGVRSRDGVRACMSRRRWRPSPNWTSAAALPDG